MALVNYPRIASFGLNIRPASGNKIFIFEAGTTTPKTTYSIPAMTAGYEQLHPVPADARGVFPAIYTTGLYKIIIKNSLGAEIYSDDNQTGNEGGLQWKGTFSSTTNSSNYPAAGDQGDVYLVTETFVLAAASGSHQLVEGDFIIANKNGAAALDADWNIYRGVGTTGVKALTPGATIATDCNDGTVFTVTLDQNSTLSNPTNKIIGKTYEWQITNAAAAIYTLAFGTNFSFPNGDSKIKAEKSSVTIIRGTVISSTVIKAYIVRNRDIGWSAGNLKINVTGLDTASLTADWIKFVSDDGDYVLKENVSETLTLSTQKSYATTEKASTWHQWHMSVAEAGGTITSKAVPDVVGTADSNSLNNLSCSTADFVGDGVTVGSKVYNTTDNTSGFVGAVTNLTTLAIVDAAGAALDLFPDGNEAFKINILKPAGFGTYKANPGLVYNNSSSHLDNSGYKKPELQKPASYEGDGTDFTISGQAGFSMSASGILIYQVNTFGESVEWRAVGYIVATQTANATASLNFSGLVFSDDSPVILNPGSAVIAAYTNAGLNTMALVFNAAHTDIQVAFNVPVLKKPTFATRT